MLATLDEAERANGKVRDEWQRQKARIVEMEEEVITKRNVMEKLEMEVRQAKDREASLQLQRAAKEKQVGELTAKLQQAQAEYKEEVATLATVANQHEHLARSLSDTEARLSTQQAALVKRKEELYQLSVRLAAERQREEQGVIEIANAQGTSKALQGKVHAMDLSSIKQQEMLYQIEFVIQGLERKVHEASGKRSLEENEMLSAIMEQLKEKRREEEREAALMHAQLKQLQEALRNSKRRQEAAHAAKLKREEELSTLRVEIEARQRQLTSVQRRVDELRVAHDKAKLDVLKLRSRLQEEQDGVWGEEQKRVDIDDAIAQRRTEIARYEELQRVELRAEEGERSRLTRELRERERQLELAKRKLATLHAKFVGSEVAGEDEEEEAKEGGEGKTQGYYIVRAGLEREEELKRQVELRAEQRRVEQEIEGITRVTLEMEGGGAGKGGGSSRGSTPVGGVGTDQAELERLREELRVLEREVLELGGVERKERKDVEVRKGVLATLISEMGQMIAAVRERQEEVERLRAAKAQLEGSRGRAEATVERRLKEWRGKRKGQGVGEEEKGGGVGGGAGGEDEELRDVLLYVGVQEGRRRWQVMREVLRGYAGEHEEMQTECVELMGMLDMEVRPSSAASSIVSHLSEEKEGGGMTGRSVRSEASDFGGGGGGGSRTSTRGGDSGGMSSQKSSARGLTGGGSRRGTSERLVIDSRGEES